MKIKATWLGIALALTLATSVAAQDVAQSGFVISLKNGSSMRGRSLTRDDASGKLRLSMTEGSYAVIAPEDTADIRSSAAGGDSINIKLKGGSELKCKEFTLNGENVSVKLGSASRIDVRWNDIESISFAQ